VFVSPSAQESFDLWYDTPRQKAMLEKLCKAIPVAIWSQIKADQDIAVEQIVGGNGGKVLLRLSGSTLPPHLGGREWIAR
jgi:hypothetical protein